MATPHGRARVAVICGRRCVITPAQEHMVRLLKRARLPFQTNVILEGFEVDVLVGERLAVELDGPIHGDTAMRRHDDAKRQVLERAGYTVVHLANEAVWHSPNQSLTAVRHALMRAARSPRPTPAPWQQTLETMWAKRADAKSSTR